MLKMILDPNGGTMTVAAPRIAGRSRSGRSQVSF
jgi:hypothetical protein